MSNTEPVIHVARPPTQEERTMLDNLAGWYWATAKGARLPYPLLDGADDPGTQLYRIARANNADSLINGEGVLTHGQRVTLSHPRWRAMVGFPELPCLGVPTSSKN